MLLIPAKRNSFSPIIDPSGIWSSPYESCRILLALPYQVSLPPVVSGSAQPCFNSGYPLQPWIYLNLSIMRSLPLLDEISPLYAPESRHPWSRHPRDPSMTLIHDHAIIESSVHDPNHHDPVNSCIWLLPHHGPALICHRPIQNVHCPLVVSYHASSNPPSREGTACRRSLLLLVYIYPF